MLADHIAQQLGGIRRLTLTTAEAAFLLGLSPGSLARWCRAHGVQPLCRMRVGRSTITVWRVADLKAASAPSVPSLTTPDQAR